MKHINLKGGKVLLTFSLKEDREDAEHPHWRMTDPHGVVTCWGHVDNGSFESMAALLRLAKLGAKHATQDELVEAGIVVRSKPKLWTPDQGGDDSMATHAGETGGFAGGRQFTQEDVSGN